MSLVIALAVLLILRVLRIMILIPRSRLRRVLHIVRGHRARMFPILLAVVQVVAFARLSRAQRVASFGTEES